MMSGFGAHSIHFGTPLLRDCLRFLTIGILALDLLCIAASCALGGCVEASTSGEHLFELGRLEQ